MPIHSSSTRPEYQDTHVWTTYRLQYLSNYIQISEIVEPKSGPRIHFTGQMERYTSRASPLSGVSPTIGPVH